MSLCVLGMSEEFKSHGIAVNALWPRTAIQTAALNEIRTLFFFSIHCSYMSVKDDPTCQCQIAGWGDQSAMLRKDSIMADAAWVLLNQPSRDYTYFFNLFFRLPIQDFRCLRKVNQWSFYYR